jgi:CheY-like chemotaxis protein
MAATAPRVLAVDDEPALRELAVAVLEDEGFDVRAAADGRQALTVLAAWPADVILLDLTMPVMDGWAFLEARRGDPALAAIPVVVMFTKVLAMELADHRINVNCVAPGVIEIPQRVSRMNEEFRAALLQAIPWGRRGQPDEVAEAVLYLCSPGAEYITGALLPVARGGPICRTARPSSDRGIARRGCP